jgi:hypothetical protein
LCGKQSLQGVLDGFMQFGVCSLKLLVESNQKAQGGLSLIVVERGVIAAFGFTATVAVASRVFSRRVKIHSITPATGFELTMQQGSRGSIRGLQKFRTRAGTVSVQKGAGDLGGSWWLDPDFGGCGITFTAARTAIERNFVDISSAETGLIPEGLHGSNHRCKHGLRIHRIGIPGKTAAGCSGGRIRISGPTTSNREHRQTENARGHKE